MKASSGRLWEAFRPISGRLPAEGPWAGKRSFDVLLAVPLFVVLLLPMVAVAATVRLRSGRPVLHRSLRVGAGGRPFTMYKFRTMVVGAAAMGPAVTAAGDTRVTGLGKVLRRLKLDELPQLFNVLRGDMSVVGPRPEDPGFVERYTPEQRRVLTVRPGITGAASVAFANEEEALAATGSAGYQALAARKLAIELEYLERQSFSEDVRLIVRTFGELIRLTGAADFARRWISWRLIDVPVVVAGFYAALLLRFLDGSTPGLRATLSELDLWIVPLVALYLGVNHLSRLDRRVWRYARGSEARAILKPVSVATLIAIAVDVAAGTRWQVRPVPLSILLAGGLFTFCGMVAVRFRSRLLTGLGWSRSEARPALQRALIFGAGETGQHLAWRLLTQKEAVQYQLAGFIDDDRTKWGLRIHGRPVIGGRLRLREVIERERVDVLIIALSHASGQSLREILSLAQETPAQIRIVPGILEWMGRPASAPLLREVRVEDLLGRKPATVDVDACRRLISGRVVMITGGCGSVGSELCRQVAGFEPRALVVLDSNESGLYDLEIELRTKMPELSLVPTIADVTDERRMRQAFAENRPEIVFHAAAYKHVPLMQRHPEEAVRVNVLGTRTVLRLAREFAVANFVLVSTDKAVNPSSVMGATKRLAEILVVGADAGWREKSAGNGPMRPLCSIVRFGNVLGSRGSVVPTFARQIELGGPVTVTSPEMTRYFMDISEAASLIIQVAGMSEGGDIFMLDMGERIRIDELARKMIRMRGLRPGPDIPIAYTGIRPGEKLHEELYYEDERRLPTAHPSIFRYQARSAQHAGDRLSSVERLVELAARCQGPELAAEVLRTVSSFEHRPASANGSRRQPRAAQPKLDRSPA